MRQKLVGSKYLQRRWKAAAQECLQDRRRRICVSWPVYAQSLQSSLSRACSESWRSPRTQLRTETRRRDLCAEHVTSFVELDRHSAGSKQACLETGIFARQFCRRETSELYAL